MVPVCCRIDGRAFSGFCKGLKRPFDERLSNLMAETTKHLVTQSGAKLGYTQSDEISLIWY
jgi:tRNA(His) 5'-end guanylyltransferase